MTTTTTDPLASLPTVLTASIACKQGAVRAVRYNVDGMYCMTCGSDKTIKLWNPNKQLQLKTYMGHGSEVLDVCASSDNANIASGGVDKMVIQWDVETGKVLKRYRAHAGRVNCVAYNEESTVIFSGSLDGTLKAWDTKGPAGAKPIQVMDEATDNVTSVAISDHEILTGSADAHVRRYDLRVGQMYADFVAKPVTSVSFTRDGQCALVSTLDSTIRLLDKDNGEMLASYHGHENRSDFKVDSCLLSNDSIVLSGSEDGDVYCWDLVDAKLITKLKHPTQQVVHSLSTHPTRLKLLTAAAQKVYLWICPTEEEETRPSTRDYPYENC